MPTTTPGRDTRQLSGPATLTDRVVRRSDFVSCNQAFIDCRTPGSDAKQNYAMVGPGVSQNADQVVNIREPHGFNIGAAGMPNGVVNNLHLHFTAEVFLCFHGEFLMRWGVDGQEGEHLLRAGDVASVPPWIFRGFTNVGPDDGILFTALGFDETGGIVWGPSVLEQAREHGLHLTTDNRLIDTVAGDALPPEEELVRPISDDELARLGTWPAERMRGRVATPEDLVWSAEPFLCSRLDGGGARLASVIGYGPTEDRDQEPRVFNPHGFNIAWLAADAGQGVLRHRQSEPQVLMAMDDGWHVHVESADGELDVELGPWDMVSVPAGEWRSLTNRGADGARLLAVNAGDGRVALEWGDDVVQAARAAGRVHDAAGYVAPLAVVRLSTIDD